jgi:glycerol-3-phosphate dehydrogenase (NAD(P)+)
MGNRVCVVGAGSWGTTVAALAAENGDAVIWARRPELADEITQSHTNRAYTGDRPLPPSLRASSELVVCLDSVSVVAMAVPSTGFRAVAARVSEFAPRGVPVVSLSKGLDAETGRRMSEVLAEEFPGSPVAVLSGPNLAAEILAGQPAAGVLACADESVARALVPSFARPTFRLYTNPDVTGCEVGGVVKNVIAIAAGIAQGLGFGDNTKAALITRGLAEMSRLGAALGARPETFAGLAGMGDLVATCASSHSRNTQVGVRLGRGETLSSIVDSMSMVAEGVRSSGAVVALARRSGIEMPICEQVAAVCDGSKTASASLLELMSRSTKGEFD